MLVSAAATANQRSHKIPHRIRYNHQDVREMHQIIYSVHIYLVFSLNR